MKLTSLECPKCGAALELNKGESVCFCPYCGTKLLMNTYSNDVDPELLQKVGGLIKPLREMEQYAGRRAAASQKKSVLEQREKQITSSRSIYIYITSGILLSVFLFCAVAARSVWWFFAGVVLAAISYGISKLGQILAKKQLQRERAAAEKEGFGELVL